ncbi:MAG: hypothetical protein V7696_06740 [Halioglobus sp.]
MKWMTTVEKALVFVFAGGAMLAASAHADSVRSECGFSESSETRPDSTSACTFSQRQGFIRVAIDGEQEFQFSPVGDDPGNYQDQNEHPVYRLSGLGDTGQLFKLPDSYLYVFWQHEQLNCQAEQLTTAGQCKLRYRDIGFDVQATTGSSLNSLSIVPSGLAIDNDELTAELDGTAYRAELADLDGNGWPEVYVYVSSAGSGSYGSLVAYAVNQGKSLTPIYLPPLDQNPEATKGYMGHDEFAVVENRLVRRFPIYSDGDTNAAATGGTRQIQYRLEAGEAGWTFVSDRVVDY